MDNFRNSLISTELNGSKKLSHARYSISRDEERVLIMAMERMQRIEELNDKGEYWFDVSDYCDVFGLSRNESLKDIKAAINKLANRWLHVKDGDEERSMRWISSKMRNTKTGKFGVVFGSDVLPLIHEISQKYSTPMRWLSLMKTQTNQRFIRWISEAIREGKTEITLTIDDLRYELDLLDSKAYELYSNIKLKKINPALENINESTELEVELEEIKKKGTRAVHSIRLFWKRVELLPITPQKRV